LTEGIFKQESLKSDLVADTASATSRITAMTFNKLAFLRAWD